jgi:hypothetical protein
MTLPLDRTDTYVLMLILLKIFPTEALVICTSVGHGAAFDMAGR